MCHRYHIYYSDDGQQEQTIPQQWWRQPAEDAQVQHELDIYHHRGGLGHHVFHRQRALLGQGIRRQQRGDLYRIQEIRRARLRAKRGGQQD